MTSATDQDEVARIAAKYGVFEAVGAEYARATALIRRSPELAHRINALIRTLPGRTETQRQHTVREIEALLAKLRAEE
jgi:hypothetical protein